MTPEYELRVYELRDTAQDGRDWLTAIVRAGAGEWPDRQQRVVNAFAKSSLCVIAGCDKNVDVGAHVTIDGRQALIIPCCYAHNAVGALDKMGSGARLKQHQIYAEIALRPTDVVQEERGMYRLQQALPNL